jgi:hypothetical protein
MSLTSETPAVSPSKRRGRPRKKVVLSSAERVRAYRERKKTEPKILLESWTFRLAIPFTDGTFRCGACEREFESNERVLEHLWTRHPKEMRSEAEKGTEDGRGGYAGRGRILYVGNIGDHEKFHLDHNDPKLSGFLCRVAPKGHGSGDTEDSLGLRNVSEFENQFAGHVAWDKSWITGGLPLTEEIKERIITARFIDSLNLNGKCPTCSKKFNEKHLTVEHYRKAHKNVIENYVSKAKFRHISMSSRFSR